MIIFVLILWLIFPYAKNVINKMDDEEKKTEMLYALSILQKVYLVFSIIIVLFSLLSMKPKPHYDEFKANVEQVMELNKPVVYECKVTTTKVKVHLNNVIWSQMSVSEKVNTKQRIRVTINNIGVNTGYIKENEEINVIFKGDKWG